MPRDAKVDRLGRVQLFSGCTTRELSQIARATDDLAVLEGTEVVRQGAPGHHLYLIVEGEADVTRDGQPVVVLGPGQYFGELAVLDGAPRGASVTARTPLSLLVLGQREFAAVLDAWPGVARKLVTQMAARLREAEQGEASH